ncbi:hypothetical protein [Lacunimicrobium album]
MKCTLGVLRMILKPCPQPFDLLIGQMKIIQMSVKQFESFLVLHYCSRL